MDAWLVDDEWWPTNSTTNGFGNPELSPDGQEIEVVGKNKDNSVAIKTEEVDEQDLLPDILDALSVGEGDDQDDSSSTDNKQQEKKKGKRGRPKKAASKAERNAEACRKHREKRKREEERLRKRNEQLEAERDMYLARIADLQSEVQNLRCAGTVDLQKENELIRNEIRRYKAFVNNLVKATNEIPDSTPEEQFWKLKSGAESGLSQMVGLLYASVSNDPSWTCADSVFLGDCEIKVKFQTLPFNAKSPESVKRVNIRVLYPPIPKDPEEMYETIWNVVSNSAQLQKLYEEMTHHEPNVKRLATDILPDSIKAIRDNLATKLTLFKYTEIREKNNSRKEHVIAGLGKRTDLHPMVFSLDGAHDDDAPMVESFCTSYSTAKKEVALECAGDNVFEGNPVFAAHFHGDIVAPDGNGGAIYTKVASAPVADENGETGFLPREDIAVLLSGKLPTRLQEDLKRHRRMMENGFELLSM